MIPIPLFEGLISITLIKQISSFCKQAAKKKEKQNKFAP